MDERDVSSTENVVAETADDTAATVNEVSATDIEEQVPQQTIIENVRKEKKHYNFMQLVIVALLCSVLGGAIVFGSIKLFDKNDASNNSQNSIIVQSDETQITAIAEKVSPSVVGIKITATINNIFTGQSQGTGEGSGIIYSSDGYILTNNHVIADALTAGTNNVASGSTIEVTLPGQIDKSYTATVVGRDVKTDIAILKIDASDLPVAELGNSDELKVGELAVAIGNPGGFDFMGTVSAGIISGLNRTIQSETGDDLTLVQTDTAINPGNSGGPLCNGNGQVIGIINIKIVATGFEGLGFAIPINQAKEIADGLIQGGYIKGRPLLGVSIDSTYTEDAAKQRDLPAGLLVLEVKPSSGAAAAGILADDIITKFDGQEVKLFSEVQTLKDKHKPGDTIEIVVYRQSDKTYKTFQVTLTEDTGTSTT
jgi:serine protease Do